MSLELSFIHQGLGNKGFKIEVRGRDHYYCRFYINGEIKTKIKSKVGGLSRRKYKTLSDNLVVRIYRSLYFDSKNQFVEFLECPYTEEEYQRMLYEKGQIDLSST